MLPECIFGHAVIESLKFGIFRDFEVMQLLDLPVLFNLKLRYDVRNGPGEILADTVDALRGSYGRILQAPETFDGHSWRP